MSATLARRGAVAGAFAVAALTAVTACGSTGGGSASTTVPPSPSSSAGRSAAALRTAKDAKLGTLVTDGRGYTLYRFDADRSKPPTSDCTGRCAAVWPPAAAPGPGSVTGIDQHLVGTLVRPDGTRQVTLNGWPLYRYSGDGGPGRTDGQGVDGTWYAVTPGGGEAGRGAAGPPSTGPASGSNGY